MTNNDKKNNDLSNQLLSLAKRMKKIKEEIICFRIETKDGASVAMEVEDYKKIKRKLKTENG